MLVITLLAKAPSISRVWLGASFRLQRPAHGRMRCKLERFHGYICLDLNPFSGSMVCRPPSIGLLCQDPDARAALAGTNEGHVQDTM